MTRLEAEFVQREAPPSYGQLIAQGLIPPVEDFPVYNPTQVKASSHYPNKHLQTTAVGLCWFGVMCVVYKYELSFQMLFGVCLGRVTCFRATMLLMLRLTN